MRVKMVRDKQAEPIRTPGKVRPVNTAPGKQALLLLKLYEEVGEIADAPNNPEEYADALEVLQTLAHHCHVDWESVVALQDDKASRLGRFARGLVWVEGNDKPVPPWPSAPVPGEVEGTTELVPADGQTQSGGVPPACEPD